MNNQAVQKKFRKLYLTRMRQPRIIKGNTNDNYQLLLKTVSTNISSGDKLIITDDLTGITREYVYRNGEWSRDEKKTTLHENKLAH